MRVMLWLFNCALILMLALPTAAQQPVTLELWIPAGRGRDESIIAVVEAFEARYPHITVELTSIPFNEFLNTLQIAYAGSEPPDVALTNGASIQYLAYNGALLPIGEIFSAADLADFMPDLIEMVTLDGQMYGAPWVQSAGVMYYNADYFAAAGIEPPNILQDRWTWAQFVENVNRVRAALGHETWGMVGLTNPMSGSFFTWTMVRSHSKPGDALWQSISPDWVTVEDYVDAPQALDAYTFYQNLYASGFMPTAEIPDAFATGQAVTYFAIPPVGAELARDFPELRWDVMPVPYFETPLLHTGSFALTISAKADQPDAARQFVLFMSSAEGYQIAHAVTPQIPGRISLQAQLPELQQGYLALVFEDILQNGRARPGGPAYTIFDTLISTEMMVNIALGGDITTEVADAIRKADAQLAQFR